MNELPLNTNGSVQVTEAGVTIHGDLSYDQWRDALSTLKHVKGIYHKALADFVGYGKKQYGTQAVDSALEQLEFDIADVNRANAISGLCLTDEGLSTEHQYVLGHFLSGKPEEQQRWAEIAKEQKLTPTDLKNSIGVGSVVRSRERVSGLPSFEAVTALFSRTARSFNVRDMTPDQKAHILETLRPILEFAEDLK